MAEQSVKPGQSVLDYGCGSAFSRSSRRNAGEPVIGIDIDPQRNRIGAEQAQRNRAEVTYGLPDACPDGEFDIVVANILSNPLKLMASMLASKVKPGGRIALSGVLARQADEVAVYASTSRSGASTRLGMPRRNPTRKPLE